MDDFSFETLEAVLCGAVLPLALCLCGLYFIFRLRAFFLLHPIRTLKRALSSDGGASSVRATTLALAGTLGVGNIAGVATAIASGGAGAVLWMEASALVAMAVKYAETSLAVTFRRRENGKNFGGAPYYIRDGLTALVNLKPLKRPTGKKSRTARVIIQGTASVFAVLCILNALTTGNLVQVNAAANAVDFLPPLAVGLIFAAVCAPVMIGGWGRISGLTLKLIPLLAGAFALISLLIILCNLDGVPAVVRLIIDGAFGFDALGGGVTGYAVSSAVRYGVTRGLFSNEAGCGTSPTAHAAAETNSPQTQGCFGIIEVFVDTTVMCTLTAFVILLSEALLAGTPLPDINGGGIPLALGAYEFFGGTAVRWAISLSVVMFAYATVICQWFYAAESIRFLCGRNKRAVRIATAAVMTLYLGATVYGSVIDAPLMWAAADVCIAVMCIINLICVFTLRRFVTAPE